MRLFTFEQPRPSIALVVGNLPPGSFGNRRGRNSTRRVEALECLVCSAQTFNWDTAALPHPTDWACADGAYSGLQASHVASQFALRQVKASTDPQAPTEL